MSATIPTPLHAAADARPGATRPLRVLVVPGGTEIGLEIGRALSGCKDVELVSAGTPPGGHAPFAFTTHVDLPSVHDDGWLQPFNAAIREHAIDLVYPAYDDVQLALASSADRLAATVIAPPADVCHVCRYKSLTYAALANAVPVPRIHPDPQGIPAFPVFAKPDRGQGSAGARAVRGPDELRMALADGADLVTELLPGAEFTVDCFSDRERGLLFAKGRTRERIRAGISMRSRPVDDPRFEEYATAISTHLDLRGAWFFQVREDADGVLRLLEVGPRIAGTMALHRVQGVNFALLSVYEAMRLPYRLMPNDVHVEIDRALVNRYRSDLAFGTVYVDLDDTLVVRGRVHAPLAGLLYQFLGHGKRVVLITRHAGELPAFLARHRVSGIFDRVVHLRDGEPKSAHITEPDAILIDDSFSERREVHLSLGIPTFDLSMIEMLVDDRV
ncbi:MAG: ATP-grasp domain-containing protein [Actinomycetota bacterium]